MTQRSQSQQHIPDGSREVPEGQHAVTAPACAEGPTSVQNPLPRLSLAETAQVVGEVQLPTIAKGPILRRPKVVAGVERLGLEARAVKRMQKVSEKYGRGPVMLKRNALKHFEPKVSLISHNEERAERRRTGHVRSTGTVGGPES